MSTVEVAPPRAEEVPIIDLAPWFDGAAEQRAAVGAEVDRALREIGFLPWVDGALTINIGDMMGRWSGDRWLSNRHRVLAPAASAPDEELISLVYFHEANPTAVLESVPPPIGVLEHQPVVAGDYLRGKLAAIALST